MQLFCYFTKTKVMGSDNSGGIRANQLFNELSGANCLIGAVGSLQDLIENNKIFIGFDLVHYKLQSL